MKKFLTNKINWLLILLFLAAGNLFYSVSQLKGEIKILKTQCSQKVSLNQDVEWKLGKVEERVKKIEDKHELDFLDFNKISYSDFSNLKTRVDKVENYINNLEFKTLFNH